MKTKIFDCVEMERKVAEIVDQKLASLNKEPPLEFWRQGIAALGEEMQKVAEASKNPAA